MDTSPTPGASDVGSNSSNINYLCKDLFVNKHEKQKYGDKKNMTLYTKGLTQSEIAEQLQVDQSTVSRDLQIIKDEARYNIEKYTKEEIPFEYIRYITGIDQITSTLWRLIENEKTDPFIKFKIQGLSLLKQCYEKRIEMLVGGSESDMNAKKHIEKILHQEKMENNPVVKASQFNYNSYF